MKNRISRKLGLFPVGATVDSPVINYTSITPPKAPFFGRQNVRLYFVETVKRTCHNFRDLAVFAVRSTCSTKRMYADTLQRCKGEL